MKVIYVLSCQPVCECIKNLTVSNFFFTPPVSCLLSGVPIFKHNAEPGRSWDGGRVRTSTRAMAKSKKKFYGVKVGRTPGVYDTWDEAEAQVKGFEGALHKSFATRAPAEKYVASPPAPGFVSTAAALRSAARVNARCSRTPPS